MHLVVHRTPRAGPSRPEPRDLSLAPPPTLPQGAAGGSVLQAVLPALGGLGMVMFLVANGNPIFLLAGMVMLMVTVGGAIALFVLSRTGARKAFAQTRARYLEYLEEQRDLLREAADGQTAYAALAHPDPVTWPTLANSARLYERRPGDGDFGQVRLGVGPVANPLQLHLPEPSSPLERLDPVCRRAALSLASAHRWVSNQPLCLPLTDCSSVVVRGDTREAALTALRALVVQLTGAHSPSDVRMAISSPLLEQDFGYAVWLPHAHDPHLRDGAVPRRWLATTVGELTDEIWDHLRARVDEAARALRVGGKASPSCRLVVVLDEYDTGPTGALRLPDETLQPADLGLTVVRLVKDEAGEPEQVDARVVVEEGHVQLDVPGRQRQLRGVLDLLGDPDALAMARALAPRLAAAEAVVEEPLVADTDVSQVLGVGDLGAWSPQRGWAERAQRELLRVPVGIRADGRALMLDLKESARGGMGPHGLLVGATGSGKSELLRSLVLALAATHSPDQLAFVLVDFKGGATFAGLEQLPHVAGVITNLESDLGMVDRMHDALFGELRRRQQVLFDAGNLPHLYAYHELRERDPGRPPLPHLLVIVDEFAELLTAKPDFIDLFTATGRIGRSIGVYQLLASQRLDEGRIRGLESFLSYRLVLRTFNADESRAALGVADAFELPPLPGSGYLKVDTTVFERFKAAYVSAPYQRSSSGPVRALPAVQPFTAANASPRNAPTGIPLPAAQPTGPSGPTVLEVGVQRISSAGSGSVHQIWLPPLPAALTLGDVVDVAREPLSARIGLLDLPSEQAQRPLTVSFAGASGHLAILGGPQTGKSTALRALAVALARRHTPEQVAIHAVDFGGGTLRALTGLPHVGTVAGRLDLDLAARVCAELVSELERREAVFAAHRIGSPEQMRALHARGELPQLGSADMFLFVDDYATVKNDHDDLHERIVSLATRGLAYGLHVVLTAPRWHDLRPALQTSITGRLELRLNDPLDSVLDRKLAANITGETPGRALVGAGRLAQIALPVLTPSIDRSERRADSGAEAAAVDTIAGQFADRSVAEIRLLPARVTLGQIEPQPPEKGSWTPLLGIAEDDLGPVRLDLLGEDPNLLVFGDRASGKTTLLRTLLGQLVAAHLDHEFVVTVVDPRRRLLDAVPEDYLGAYAPNATAAAGLAQSLAAELRARQPATTDPVELARHTWHGPRIVCLVDDADLVLGMPSANPLAPLLEFLPAGPDLGFHLLLTRHAGGAARALFEPTLQRVKELGAPALLLSGDKEEGQLWPGATMRPRPPGRGLLVRRGRAPRLMQVAVPE